MLYELFNIAINAYYYGDESITRQKLQNDCLAAKRCEARYINSVQAWAITPRTHFSSKGKTYKIEDCLSANTCHYDFKNGDYVVGPDSTKMINDKLVKLP